MGIGIFILLNKNKNLKYQQVLLHQENEALNKRITSYNEVIDSISTVNDGISKANLILKESNVTLKKKIKVKDQELASIENKYNPLKNDSLTQLAEKRLNPDNIPGDTLAISRPAVERSLEIQDSLVVYKDIREDQDSIINNDIAIIANDSVIINNQTSQIVLKDSIIISKDQIIGNKDKEIKIIKRSNTIKTVLWTIGGIGAGAIATALIILL